MQAPDLNSPYYPYERVQTGYSNFRGWDDIPYKILLYLMDLPDANGYTPRDDNALPRCRLWKLIANDDSNPLAGPLPTPEEKRSMLFDADEPDLNTDEQKAKHPKGYRLLAQNSIGQSQLKAQTRIFCYLGREIPYTSYQARTALIFEIWSNVNLDTNTKTRQYKRTDSIEQALKEALNGVNITGIGTVQYDRGFHGDCGSSPIWDEYSNTGRRLIMALTWADSDQTTPGA